MKEVELFTVGPKVNKVKPKDKVVNTGSKALACKAKLLTIFWKKKINAGWVTTFNEYALFLKID